MYQPIPYLVFDAKMREIGASLVFDSSINEYMYDLPIVTKSGKTFPEKVRIYSSISNNGYCRAVGKDAIRVVLMRDEKPLLAARRVNRTGDPTEVMERVVSRCRDAFKYAINPENRGPSGHLFRKNRSL